MAAASEVTGISRPGAGLGVRLFSCPWCDRPDLVCPALFTEPVPEDGVLKVVERRVRSSFAICPEAVREVLECGPLEQVIVGYKLPFPMYKVVGSLEPRRFGAVGYGEFRPLVPNDTEEQSLEYTDGKVEKDMERLGYRVRDALIQVLRAKTVADLAPDRAVELRRT